MAEALGTALLVGIGTGCLVAETDYGGVPLALIALAWFVAVAVPIQLFAPRSGAHLNPVVTIGLVAVGRFAPRDAPAYIGSQLAGALVASAAVWGVLGRGDHLGATLPGPAGPAWILPLEFVFTFVLVGSVLYVSGRGRDPRRIELIVPAAVVGLSTYLIGPWTGSSLNPARSFAPAVLSGDLSWLWLYVIATVLGSLGAAAVSRWT